MAEEATFTKPIMGSELGDVFDPIYSVTDSGVLDFRMLLDGKWVSLDQRIEVHSPINDSLVALVPRLQKRKRV